MPEYEEPVLVLVLDCKLLFDKLYSKRMAPILGNKSYSLRVGLVMLYVEFTSFSHFLASVTAF